MPENQSDAVNCWHMVDDKPKENHVMVVATRVETIPDLATMQVAQEPRRQELTAEILDDLWRSACEMPDAPHLSKR